MNSDSFSTDMAEGSQNCFRDWPTISVIVATHRRPDLLRRALDSILAQTFRDIEVLVIHDGPIGEFDIDGTFEPTDEVCAGTAAVFGEYSDKFYDAGIDFFTLATDEHTGYYCIPRNVATENCRGVYVANLDDDNEWLPDALEALLASMEEGEVWPDLVYGRRRYIVSDDSRPELKALEGESVFTPWDDIAMTRLAGNQPALNFIDSSDFLVAKGALYRLGVKMGRIWDDTKRRFGDFYLVSDGLLAGEWRFKPLDKVVQNYYVHGQNVSLTRSPNEAPRTVNV